MSVSGDENQFHNAMPAVTDPAWLTGAESLRFSYTFENFFHPFIPELTRRLNRSGVPGMLHPDAVGSMYGDNFDSLYTRLQDAYTAVQSQPEVIDLTEGGPYANYNWELLFHVPLTIAVHLSRNQRFAEAQRWFHLIFDPTANEAFPPAPQRFWRFLRFRTATPAENLATLLALLSKPVAECTPTERDARQRVLDGYEAARRTPFKPHAVARTRVVSYQYDVVMKYLDNLLAWGDNLFAQDTSESINEATQRYVLAANILGPRPEQLPARGRVRARSFNELKAAKLDAMGNALVELEGQFPFDVTPPVTPGGGTGGQAPLFGLGRTLYFCVPRNDKLLSYWDLVGDRLFKIRHCMNLQGVVRPLAPFDPPIDPAGLVRAASSGIDVGSIVSGLNQPLSPVRSLPLMQKALELCAEVRSLGAGVLGAIEKHDAERLALLRQSHELTVQGLARETRFLQLKQAQAATESLAASRAAAVERYHYYLRLLGRQPDAQLVPQALALDRRELTAETFDEAYAALVAQYDRPAPTLPYPRIPQAGAASPGTQAGASSAGSLRLTAAEAAQLNQHLPRSRDLRLRASTAEIIATVLTFIPEFDIDIAFWGLGGGSTIFGGTKLSDALKIGAEIARTEAAWETDQAQLAGLTASYERRLEEWTQQANLAADELTAIGRQILTSLVAEQVARQELATVDRQIQQTREVDRFLREDKRAGEDLYAWMQGEMSRLYYEYYRFAVDVARKAERTMKHELMRGELDDTQFVRFNYWDQGRNGLLAADALHLDLKRMELAYHEHNRRELELTRHVSVRQLSPLALLRLRTTGRCEVTIPEWLFDRDLPGAYLRRIRTVALSLPTVAGPYTSVNCTLSLVRSSVRVSPLLDGGAYERSGREDPRFVDYLGAAESVVTSSASNDSGLFDTNLRDERFLPFEGAGAVSTWRLELPAEFHQFDYARIADAILHLRYTARQGGAALGDQAGAAVRRALESADTSGAALLFSLPHDFATAWATFAGGTGDLRIVLSRAAFPYLVQDETISVVGLDLYSDRLLRRAVAVPGGLDAALAGPTERGEIVVPSDGAVLQRTSKEVYLLVRYQI